MTKRWGNGINWRGGPAIGGGVIVGCLALGLVFLASFPIAVLKPVIEDRLSSALDTEVAIGAVSRSPTFSFKPEVTMTDIRIRQPQWAGTGQLLDAKSATIRISTWAILAGNLQPSRLRLDGVRVALVRDADGRSNWTGSQPDDEEQTSQPWPAISNLSINDVRFTLDDRKRRLQLAGRVDVEQSGGLRIAGRGTFLGSPASLSASGGPISGVRPSNPYPFRLSLRSPALELEAEGEMSGLLDTGNFEARMTAAGPTLKNLDHVIEAGLFGSQPIDIKATVRREDRDWHIRSLRGSVGRSEFAGNARVLKRGERTRVVGTVRASRFDFDDLADDAGQAQAAALRARLGPRIIPDTRINLSKIGNTDIEMDFAADRLLARDGSVFRSLKAKAILDRRLLTVTDIVARMDQGAMTGDVRVDHRSGDPKLSTNLRFRGATLDLVFGNPEIVTGPVRGVVALSGSGDTVREALAKANGKVGMVASRGSMKAAVADVLGQDLGKTIGQMVSAPSQRDPLHCLVAAFTASNGVLTPSPLVISAGSSVGRGSGRIVMDGERVDLTLRGAASRQSGLRIADPIRVHGTLSSPQVSVAGLNAKTKPTLGRALKVLGKSVGNALGLGDNVKSRPEVKVVAEPVNCQALSAKLFSQG